MHRMLIGIGAVLASGALLTGAWGCDETDPVGAIEPAQETEAAEAEPAAAAVEVEEGSAPEGEPRIRELDVEAVAGLVDEGSVAIFDANGESTRREHGVVPGAVLLGSSDDYDLALLPEDKSQQLVFYCANTRCGASDAAAERAVEAGYAKVAVMRPGIEGWKEAGKPTEPPKG